jgi:hypothetical protein
VEWLALAWLGWVFLNGKWVLEQCAFSSCHGMVWVQSGIYAWSGVQWHIQKSFSDELTGNQRLRMTNLSSLLCCVPVPALYNGYAVSMFVVVFLQ